MALRAESDRVFVALTGQAEIPIRIDRRPRHRGGNERLFVCPACQRSVWHIYLPQLCCRLCVRPRLIYGVWRYAGKDRRPAQRWAAKLRARIGAVPGLGAPLPRKPKLVRSDYYRSWLAELAMLEAEARRELRRAEGKRLEKSA